jgi:hypothetical protein
VLAFCILPVSSYSVSFIIEMIFRVFSRNLVWVSAHTNVVEETIVHPQACRKKSVHTESCAEHGGRE